MPPLASLRAKKGPAGNWPSLAIRLVVCESLRPFELSPSESVSSLGVVVVTTLPDEPKLIGLPWDGSVISRTKARWIVHQEVAWTTRGVVRIGNLARALADVSAIAAGTTILASARATVAVIVRIAVLITNRVHAMAMAVAVTASSATPAAALSTGFMPMSFAAGRTAVAAAIRTPFVPIQEEVVRFVTTSPAGYRQHRNEGPNEWFHGR